MHASMKMMYMGNSENMQKRLKELLISPCTQDAKRFCFMETPSHEKIKDEILNDYKERHDGKLPKCMKE